MLVTQTGNFLGRRLKVGRERKRSDQSVKKKKKLKTRSPTVQTTVMFEYNVWGAFLKKKKIKVLELAPISRKVSFKGRFVPGVNHPD